MVIKVLGSGCTKCKMLTNVTREAVNQLGLDAEIIKVEDFMQIRKYGVMVTPALVVDDKVVMKGKVLSVNEVVELLKSL